MLNCQLCLQENGDNSSQQQSQFPSLDQLEAHLAAEHFGVLPYECEQCQFAKFPTEFAVMKHNELDHGNKHYSFRCRITPEIKLKRRQVHEYLLTVTHPSSKITQKQHVQPQQQHVGSKAQQSQGGPSPCLQPLPSSSTTKFMPIASLKTPTATTSSSSINNNSMPLVKKEMMELDESISMQQQSKKQVPDDEMPSVEGNNEAPIDEELSETNPTSLMEKIQAACMQNMRRSSSGSGRLPSRSFGGTLEIREGAELPPSLLANDYGSGEERHEDSKGMMAQQADVQEILKAAAAAVSQVGSGVNNSVMMTGGYSLRPNRFSPYALRQNHWQQQTLGSGAVRSAKALTLDSQQISKREKVIERIECRKCHEMVNSTGGCLNHHVNTRHLRLPMFQCKLCNKDFFEVSNTRIHKHIRLHHGGDTTNLISNYHQYSVILHSARDECFGRKEERVIGATRTPAATGRNISGAKAEGAMGGGKTGTYSGYGGFGTATRNSAQSAAANCATVHAVFHSRDDEIGVDDSNSSPLSLSDMNVQKQLENSTKEENGKAKLAMGETDDLDVLIDEEEEAYRQQEGEEEEEEEGGGEEEADKGDDAPPPMQLIDLLEVGNEGVAESPVEHRISAEGEDDEEEESEHSQQFQLLQRHKVTAPKLSPSSLANQIQQQGGGGYWAGNNDAMLGMGNVHSTAPTNNAHLQFQQQQQMYTQQQRMMAAAQGQQHYPQQQQQQVDMNSYPTETGNVVQDQLLQQQQAVMVGGEEKVPCKVCGEMVWNKMTNRLNHVNVRHLQLPLHECALCRKSFTSYSRSACYSHVQFAHRTEIETGKCSAVIEEHIIYMKERYNGQLMEAANDYFN